VPADLAYEDELGVRLGQRWRPLDAVGLYVPGGTAAYPSSVLMNAIPAKVAGVRRLVMVVPTPDGVLNPLVLAAADLAGVDEIYRVGGAQAVAALAYGTAAIAHVDKVVGPGNAYVAEAKRQVFGRVGIDMVAGPSEVVVVADAGAAPAAWLAADLLAQAEHDALAQSVLVTDDLSFADEVAAAVADQLSRLPRGGIAAASWAGQGAVIVVPAIGEETAALVDALAPEHLQLVGPRAEALEGRIRHAGSVFLGAHTPEVIGDYVGGPNHVLPTGRTARFASGLAVHDFLKRTTIWAARRKPSPGSGPRPRRSPGQRAWTRTRTRWNSGSRRGGGERGKRSRRRRPHCRRRRASRRWSSTRRASSAGRPRSSTSATSPSSTCLRRTPSTSPTSRARTASCSRCARAT
jgi:histidinol dehydrogenase